MHGTRIACYISVASVIGAGALASDTLWGGAAVLLVVGLASAVIGAHLAGVKVKPSRSAARRVGTIAAVGLVVTTAALSGMGGPASPVETVQAGYFEGCQFSDSVTFAIGSSLGLSDQDCTFYTPDTNVEEISATDAYANALTANESYDSFLTTQENFGNDMRSVAWSKAKISIVNDLNNNVSEANATANAKSEVNQYYWTNMKNILRDYSARSSQASYLADATTTSDKSDQVYAYASWSSNPEHSLGVNTTTWTYVFPDNSTLNITSSKSWEAENSRWGYHRPRINRNGYSYSMDGGADYVLYEMPINVKSNDTADETTVYNLQRYTELLESRDDQRTQVNSNIETYVNETYAAYEAGEIDSTDLAASDPTTIASQAATDYNSTGYYGLASAQLAAMGLSGNETVSHVVNTTENGSDRQITGTLFYTGEDSQTFETGTEYDPATLNGSVYMSVASIEDGNGTKINNSGGFYYLEEPFTVSEATDTQTGEAVNTTTMETRDYSTTNVSKLAAEIDQLKEQRDYYESQQAASGGGFGFDLGGTQTGIVIALAAVVILLARD